MAESWGEVQARLDEVQGVLDGLRALEGDMRAAAGKNLGRVPVEGYVGMTAQMQLVEQLRQPLEQRAALLVKRLEEPPEGFVARFPSRRAEGDEVPADEKQDGANGREAAR